MRSESTGMSFSSAARTRIFVRMTVDIPRFQMASPCEPCRCGTSPGSGVVKHTVRVMDPIEFDPSMED
jgi:hypothetical protein